jgi:hypothetical protein
MNDGIENARPLKVQTTVNGFTAWVFRQLADRTQQPAADLAKSALDRWVAHESEYLGELGITHERFMEVVAGSAEIIRMRRRVNSDEPPGAG